MERYTLIGLACSLLIIFSAFYLLRKRKIQGKGFVFWFLVGLVLCVFSIAPSLIYFVYFIFGTDFTISSIMAMGFLFFLLATFYLYIRLTELRGLLKKLAMEVSVAKYDAKRAKRDTVNPKSGNNLKQKDDNERKTSRSRRKTNV